MATALDALSEDFRIAWIFKPVSKLIKLALKESKSRMKTAVPLLEAANNSDSKALLIWVKDSSIVSPKEGSEQRGKSTSKCPQTSLATYLLSITEETTLTTLWLAQI